MIDLSFLTQEESEKIMAVLKRDAELKKAEEKRIQNLQRTVADKSQLKCLTGEWFYESKQLRHQECIHGSDIIRASIRRKSIPLTKVEASHTLTKKSTFGTNERKGASEPSSPCRLREEPNIAG
ncbi:synaptotagmin-like protein 2 [Cyprinodon tularosa]|uniref:synaptotagmin-like protein 2 n=1 Tax=Cyprinodon tularosa TaxID=77115 RepID=UPI0018E233C8|nr:synaptotagmin-like protein 2 [Cyprinodon tularosa]